MEPATWGFIGAITGALVGASASIATTAITAWNTRRLQQAASKIERSDRAREFQRQNLLELQEALSEEMRLVTRAHHEDMKSFALGGNRDRLLSEDLNQDLFNASRKTVHLVERVANDELRSDLKSVRRMMADLLLSDDAANPNAKMTALGSKYISTMESLGTVLRASY